MKKLRISSLIVTAIIFSSASFAYNSDFTHVTQDDNSWHFMFAPYLWMSELSGDVTVDNFTAHTHLSFADILKQFDFGAEAHLEANYNRWTFMIDPTYIKLTDHSTVDSLDVTTTNKTIIMDTGAYYRFLESNNAERPTSLELLGGARYYKFATSIDVDTDSFSDNIHSFAPVIGLRLKQDFNQKTHAWIRGDVGGFNVDHMKNTWSGAVGLSYTIHRHIDIGAAYKILRIDYENQAKQFNMDTLMYGPEIGISFYN